MPSDKILPKESKRYEIFTKVRIALQEGRNAFPETDRDRYQAYSDILGKLTQGDKSVIPKTNENIEAFIYRIAPPNMTRDQMHWDYPALSDLLPHALIPAFKREPTWTNKGRTDENWNGLTFGGETADCKHLSWVYCHPELIEAFVCELLSEPGKLSALLDKLPIDLANSFRSTVDRFQSGDNVKLKFLDLIAQSPLTMEAFFTSKAGSIKNITIAVNTMMALGPTHKRQTDDRNFGRLLGDVSELMRFHRKHDVHIFGATNTHAMAARVQWKKDEKGAPKIRVTFYDPNLTGDHKIVEASTPKELHQHSLDDCFNPDPTYFLDGQRGVIRMQAICMTAICMELPFSPGRAYHHLLNDGPTVVERLAFQAALKQAMAYGIPDDILRMNQRLQEMGISGDAAAPFLKITDSEGATLTHHAFYYKEGKQSFEPYAKLLSSRGIVGANAIPWMETRTTNGETGPYLAFRQRDGESLKAYARALRFLGIVGHPAVPLMEASAGAGNPESGVNLGRLNDDGKTIDDFTEALEVLGIRGDAAKSLFKIVDSHGTEHSHKAGDDAADKRFPSAYPAFQRAKERLEFLM